MAEAQAYVPRNAKKSALYQMVVEHREGIDEYYTQHYAERYGPWRSRWNKIMDQFLRCGDLHYGFARVYCRSCKHSFLRPLSCGSRNFCPSCEAKRRALWVEHVVEDILPGAIPYRMIVFTMPKSLRAMFMRERSLLGDAARLTYHCTLRFFQELFSGVDGVPYFISSVHTWGNFVNPHPHFHSLCSCGIKGTDGVFYAVPEDCDFSPLEEMFRVELLDMLYEKKRITEKTRKSLMNWRHSGFSADASVGVQGGDREGLERITAYTLHPPLSLKRLNYVSGSSKVVYTGRFNPGTKSNFTVLDCRDFLCNLLLHVPHPWEALIRYYGAAASTTRRGEESSQEPLLEEGEGEYKSKSKRSWARLIKKHFGRDPLTCPKCGSAMDVIALIKDEEVIDKILRHLKIWDPPTGPPFEPEVKETVYDYTFFDDVPPDELTN